MNKNLTDNSVYFSWGTSGFVLRRENCDSYAYVRYSYRKNQIVLYLCGELRYFGEFLSSFYNKLNDLVVKSDIKECEIHPWVIFDEKLFSLHSSENFIRVLEQCPNYSKLIEEVKKMSAKIINNINGSWNTTVLGSENVNINLANDLVLNEEQHKIIEHVLDQVLTNHATELSASGLQIIAELKALTDNPQKQLTNESSKPILHEIINSLVGLTGFSADAISVGQFITNHSDKISALASTIFILLKNVPSQ